MFGELCTYTPAPWMETLKDVPSVRISLAMTPTPIHKWNLPGIPHNFQVYIKRDDMTGSTLTGNKVRKLEFIFGHVIQNGYKHVITSGSILSNHCRATAIIGAQLGLKSHLLLRSDANELRTSNGNVLLSRMCGADIYLVPNHRGSDLKQRREALAEEILARTGETSYGLVGGGSNALGSFGYLDAWREMMEQGVQERFDDVVIVGGSGGTITGLGVGNYLTGSKVKVHAVTISSTAVYLHNHINVLLEKVGLGNVESENIVDIIEGYIGAGYGVSTDEDHEFCKTIASMTGVLCDPIYTGKGAKGLISELNSNPSRFQGNRILFVHTGGIFDLYDGRMFDMFSKDKVHEWKDIKKSPKEFFD